MQVASPETVLARAEVPADAKYTFGVYPLQQYLVPGERGRLDVYSRAWDARPAAEGGQRWFYPTGSPPALAQNWNSECAGCHSTGIRKRYDLAHDSFDTQWSEVSVGCEACHGPGSRHVAWATTEPLQRPAVAVKGFEAPLRAASAFRWVLREGDTIAHAEGGHAASTSDPSAEVNRCVACHARRVALTEEPERASRLLDAYAPNLIEAGLYHVDGQLDDENFEYGSFVQSRMFSAGVTCSNCHEPHRAKLRAEGNALCAQCHVPKTFDTNTHHHHAEGSDGARCVNCHMPKHTFMGVHVRRDHYVRVPRPDLTVQLGTPNACSDCHADRSAGWAAEQIASWGGRPPRAAAPVVKSEPSSASQHEAQVAVGALTTEPTKVAIGFDAGRRGSPRANQLLAAVAVDVHVPAMQRASAAALLRGALDADARKAWESAASAEDDLIRLGAARALEALGGDDRIALGSRLLGDPARAVRIEAARALADVPLERLEPARRPQLTEALAEWLAARNVTSDRPETHVDVAQVYARRGELARAEQELQTALRIDPQNLAARINLADLQRATGRDADAERLLRQTIEAHPKAAVAWHALGLALVRLNRREEALVALAKAYELEPSERDYASTYAVALRELRGTQPPRMK